MVLFAKMLANYSHVSELQKVLGQQTVANLHLPVLYTLGPPTVSRANLYYYCGVIIIAKVSVFSGFQSLVLMFLCFIL